MRHAKRMYKPGNKRLRKAMRRGLYKAASYFSNQSSQRRLRRQGW